MHLYEQGRRRHQCPACGREVRRVHRTEEDLESRFADALGRYRCVSRACGWDGLLPLVMGPLPRGARSPRGAVLPRLQAAGRGALRAWPLALAALATAAAVGYGLPEQAAAPQKAAAPLAPGEHHDGVDISLKHPLLKAAVADEPALGDIERLALKQGCAWGKPGRNPYRGSVEQALLTAKLPPEVIQRVALKVKQGQVDDRLEIDNAGIRARKDGRQFDQDNVALTYGHTLCVNARVNFPAGHVEQASLYEAADRKGNLYAVMVPDVCGNVSVLGARMERKRTLPVLALSGHEGPMLLRLVAGGTEDPGGRSVPEPGTLAAVLAALAALAGVGRFSRRRKR